jgi:hypothetical protein
MPVQHRTKGGIPFKSMLEKGTKVYHLEPFSIIGQSPDQAA